MNGIFFRQNCQGHSRLRSCALVIILAVALRSVGARCAFDVTDIAGGWAGLNDVRGLLSQWIALASRYECILIIPPPAAMLDPRHNDGRLARFSWTHYLDLPQFVLEAIPHETKESCAIFRKSAFHGCMLNKYNLSFQANVAAHGFSLRSVISSSSMITKEQISKLRNQSQSTTMLDVFRFSRVNPSFIRLFNRGLLQPHPGEIPRLQPNEREPVHLSKRASQVAFEIRSFHFGDRPFAFLHLRRGDMLCRTISRHGSPVPAACFSATASARFIRAKNVIGPPIHHIFVGTDETDVSFISSFRAVLRQMFSASVVFEKETSLSQLAATDNYFAYAVTLAMQSTKVHVEVYPGDLLQACASNGQNFGSSMRACADDQ